MRLEKLDLPREQKIWEESNLDKSSKTGFTVGEMCVVLC